MVHGKNSTMESAVLALAERQPLLRARDLTAQALPSAVDEADLGPFERLLAVLGRPYETVESARPFTLPASPEVAAAHRTFCGT